MDTRCSITELPINQCAHCLGHKSSDEEEREDFKKFVSNLLRFAPVPVHYCSGAPTCNIKKEHIHGPTQKELNILIRYSS